MSISLETLALSKSYTKKSIIGLGAIKGANCQVSQIVNNGDGTHTITFLWKDINDVSHTSDLIVKDGETPTIVTQAITGGHRVTFTTTDPAQSETFDIIDGEDGVSITDVDVNASNHLIVTLSTGSTIDAGEITVVNELSAMDDVTITTPSDGESLVYDAESNKWINKELSYEYSIEDLKDVNINVATLQDGDVIVWNAAHSKWEKGEIPVINVLNDVGNVTISQPTNGQILKYNSVKNKWENGDASSTSTTLDDLANVNIDETTLENNQILYYDAENEVWVNGEGVANIHSLGDIDDVDLENLENGQIIIWDEANSKWVNGNVATKFAELTDVTLNNPVTGNLIRYNTTTRKWENFATDTVVLENSTNVVTGGAIFTAIKAISDKIGALANLNTIDKTSVVNSINEIVTNLSTLSTLIGALTNLNTIDKTNLVNAINELVGDIGSLSNLVTTDKTSLVNAINELASKVIDLKYFEQFTTMPTASKYKGRIVQYVGSTSADYTKGYIYYSEPSVEQGEITYNWIRVDVQPTIDDYNDLQNKPTISGVEVVGDKTLGDFGIQGQIQFNALPQPSNALVGKIVEYTGATTASFKTGYFYRCQYVVENDDYEWIQIDVSSNSELANRITTLETNQGNMSALTIAGVGDLVSAINVLAIRGIKSITYVEPYLTITLMDNTAFQFDIRVILQSTEIGDLANVFDSNIQNGDLLVYDSSISKYKPYDIASALNNILQNANDYTDQEIASAVQEDAYVCDSKPTCTYDSVSSKYVVVYYQNSVAKTTTAISSRFYYKGANNDPYCTSWFETGDSSVDPVEFTYLVSTPDFSDYVNKNTDVVSTYNTGMADKSKIPDIAAMDALYDIVATALSLKVNTADIINALNSDATNKPLSAAQGKALKGLVDEKQDIIQMSTMPQVTAQMVTDKVIYQYVGATSQSYTQGYFYLASYNQTQDEYYWKLIEFAPDMVEITAAEVDALWA